jgi:hypothetical protein
MRATEIGGIEDHVHLLLSLPATLSVSKAAQLIKGGSSKWVHDTFPEHRLFQWQEKYGSFSVSVGLSSAVPSGLAPSLAFPAVNCRAFLGCPYGTAQDVQTPAPGALTRRRLVTPPRESAASGLPLELVVGST